MFLLCSLEEMGFAKLVNAVDAKEAERMGLYVKPLTQKNIEKHLEDLGIEPEFGTHNHIRGLSGGQKVKVLVSPLCKVFGGFILAA